nr:MAG TPA: hypothetical protein [Caudoviricetes sp.]
MTQKRELLSREAANDIWRAICDNEIAKGDRINRLHDLVSDLRVLNHLTGCSANDPLGFFFTNAYSERLKEHKEIKRVLPGEISEILGDSVRLHTPQEIGSLLSRIGVAKVSLSDFLGMLRVKCAGEGESNGASLNPGDDDRRRLISGEREVVIFVL